MNIDFLATDTDVHVYFGHKEFPRITASASGILTKMLADADIVGLAEFKAKLRDFIRAEIVKHIRPAEAAALTQEQRDLRN